ncbi:MAG: hypothetical protein H7101_11210, partial [Deinococcales bacterium]|nr:hypothetical protein [Chitinophagaceae bacterium]
MKKYYIAASLLKFAMLFILINTLGQLIAQPIMVKDINLGSGSSNIKHHTNVNGNLWFINTIASVDYLYKSDGTDAGT